VKNAKRLTPEGSEALLDNASVEGAKRGTWGVSEERFSVRVHGFEINAHVTELDDGLNVLLTGGSKTHIGALSYAAPGGNPKTISLPGHKDSVIGERWALALAGGFGRPAAVECGIHYENASKEQIDEIVLSCERLLQEILKKGD
jgi:hypothetical protein